MTDILDLDALLPPPRHVILGGKKLEIKPLTIRQIIILSQFREKLKTIQDGDEMLKTIRDTISLIMPAYGKDDSIDFTVSQMFELIAFAQSVSIPETATEAKKYDPKKKVSSPVASPISSDSTPDTQPKPS